jgi:hypothetical protein
MLLFVAVLFAMSFVNFAGHRIKTA